MPSSQPSVSAGLGVGVAAAASALILLAGIATATPPRPADPAAFALVVGSNAGGEGQARLRYAERDAGRMAEVLRELGGVRADHVALVLHPGRAALDRALDRLTDAVAAATRAGQTPKVFFYYSGHARAAALELGGDELPLTELRRRLTGLTSGLTVVVLDACQSGAFSRIKGAAPAADFSYNSRARLDATGIAVLASSSASELSQESDRLASSYFTHNFLVGLRGAGDQSGDGEVSLDEAYRYAYHQTLLETAATRVGTQHVSLEEDVKGKGEVPLTWPAAADAQLTLAAPLEAEVLVERRPAQQVVAELHKAPGAAVRLGLPAGTYRVLVRAPNARVLRRCDLTLARGADAALAPGTCARVAIVDDATKGPGPGPGGGVAMAWPGAPTRERDRWSFEVGFGFEGPVKDRFTQRLTDFGYQDQTIGAPLRLSLSAVRRTTRYLSLVGELTSLDTAHWSRQAETRAMDYTWTTFAAGLHARGLYPLVGGHVAPFVQVGGGLAGASTHFTDANGVDTHDGDWGFYLGAGVGVKLQPWRHLGFVAQGDYTFAPVINNLIGDTHDSGGVSLRIGLSWHL